jgi:Ni/Fe-hydrogenase subunit HybB-like protein
MLVSNRVRQSRRWLFTACTLIVVGVVINRLNVFVVGYKPPVTAAGYFPSIGEIMTTAGLIATLMLIYRFLVTHLPVLSARRKEVC